MQRERTNGMNRMMQRWTRLLSLVLVVVMLGTLVPVSPVRAVVVDDAAAVVEPAPQVQTVPSAAVPPVAFAPTSEPAVVELASAPPEQAESLPATAALTTPAQLQKAQGLMFLPNRGQTDPTVRFHASAMGGDVFFTPDEVVLALPVPITPTRSMTRTARRAHTAELTPTTAVSMTAVQLRFDDANPTPQMHGTDQQPGMVNYIIGNDPDQWQTHIPIYAGIVYDDLYPGIDLRYDGTHGRLKGTYILEPGADPARIRWRYEGATAVRVDPRTGDLRVTLRHPARGYRGAPPVLVERAPIAWQEAGDRRTPVAVEFTTHADGSVGFTLGAYDPTRLLYLDPDIEYSSYLGGSSNDSQHSSELHKVAVALDNEGNMYLTGFTYSGDFPNTSEADHHTATDMFITKMHADGSLAYSTYMGHKNHDYGFSIAVDSSGHAYVAGYAVSKDFPTTSGVYRPQRGRCASDAVVVKLNPDGTLNYSTFLGGGGRDNAWGIAIDSQGSAYVTGRTKSAIFKSVADPDCGDQLPNNQEAAFVTKISADASELLYLQILDGTQDDEGNDIAVDAQGNAYVAGYTKSDNFPATNPLGITRCQKDGFVTKLDSAGTVVFTTLIGGSSNDEVEALVLSDESSPTIYLIGSAYSEDFPVSTSAFRTTKSGTLDAFVMHLNADGQSFQYSTFLGGRGGKGIALDGKGEVYATGHTGSNFPVTDDAIQSSLGGHNDAFIAVLNATGTDLVYGSYFGGQENDHGHDLALTVPPSSPFTNSLVSNSALFTKSLVLVGTTQSTDAIALPGAFDETHNGGWDVFVTRMKIPWALLPDDQCRATEEHCPCTVQPCQGDPVNTRSGNFFTPATDLVVGGTGPSLAWTRTYNSQATDEISETGSLGYGWQHPFATRLVTETAHGEPGVVIVRSPAGNNLRFRSTSEGYSAYPGVNSTLTVDGNTTTWTRRDQTEHDFNTAGHLTAVRDAQGRAVTLSYDGQDRLYTIRDSLSTHRALTLTYASGLSPRIASITDGHRTVAYAYTGDDLTEVRDVMNRPTTYTYENHLLTQITNALGESIVRTDYERFDAQYQPQSKVISQTLQDGQTLAFAYTDAQTTITTTLVGEAPVVEVYTYDERNVLTGVTRDGTTVAGVSHSDTFAPEALTDGNGHTTQMAYQAMGLPTQITNPLGQTTAITYNDALRPTTITDPLGRTTSMTYDPATNSLTSATMSASGIAPLTTQYRYEHPTRPELLTATETPDGIVTTYVYDGVGQVIATTVGAGTAEAQTTTYEYDALGRVFAVTIGVGTPLERRDVTEYNADNTIARTIQNYQDGDHDPDVSDQDIITTYGYDGLGRPAWTCDVRDHCTATHYNAQGQVDWTIRNLVPLTFDGQGQPLAQPFDPAHPDRNVRTDYTYDGFGRLHELTQHGLLTGDFDVSTRQFPATATRTTRMEYDEYVQDNKRFRSVTTIQNYQDGSFDADHPDVDVSTTTHYDPAGNVVRQIDALGRETRTEYDALNRPITTTVNYVDGDPLTGSADTDIIQVTEYTAEGLLDRTIANYVDGVFDAAAPDADRSTEYDYDALGRVVDITRNATAVISTATNLHTATAYDDTGRVLGHGMEIPGPSGTLHWDVLHYDALGRVAGTTRNCTEDFSGTPADPRSPYWSCIDYNAVLTDQNITSQTRYDALGRVVTTTAVYVDGVFDPAFPDQDVVTLHAYDALGRVIHTTQHSRPGVPASSDTNVTTGQTYDSLGRVATRTDAEGATTQYTYDALGRTTIITDAAGLTTHIGPDGTGVQRWIETPQTGLTLHEVDGLGRVTATIVNYGVGGIPVGQPIPTDSNLRTEMVYDAAGRVVATVDAEETHTHFEYDWLDRLVCVVENAETSSTTCAQAVADQRSDVNVVTQYAYDRAGNRTTITDARGHTRTFAYDAADRLVQETDALGQSTTYVYDRGGRLTTRSDPRGASYDLTYYHDEQHRVTAITATALADITFTYDALGRRTALGDATGTTTFAPDALGRITQVTAPDTGTIGYAYNARGQRTQLTYPDTTVLDYTYGADGRLSEITVDNNFLASYGYDSAGRLSSITRGNGTVTTHSYDDVSRLTDLHTTDGTMQTLTRFTYTLDKRGLRTDVTETIGGSTRPISYTYDGVQRLVGASEDTGNTFTYGYDRTGNITATTVNGVTTSARSYNAANQVVGWHYDEAGNLLGYADTATSYAYDPLNRLTSAANGAITYASNGDGVLVAETAGGTTTRYTQDLAAPLAQVLHISGGSEDATYLYGVQRLAAVEGTATTWALHDALGSVRQTLDDAGDPIAASGMAYTPFGVPQSGATPQPFGFTGEVQSDATGLVYLRARWYDPGRGVFTGRDTFAGFERVPYSQHPYQYGYSNPLLYTDPSGREGELCWAMPGAAGCEWIPWSWDWGGVEDELNDSADTFKAGSSVGIDFVPVVGDVKGIAEVFTGCDLVTGEELGPWRYAGLAGFVGLAELRQLRHADVALPAINRLRTHFEQTASGADAICYACVLNTLNSGRYPYEDVLFMAPQRVIPELQSLGFRQVNDLQPGDVVVWIESFSSGASTLSGHVDDLGEGFSSEAAAHMGIYLGAVDGKPNQILSGNWPHGEPPGMYNMDEIVRAPSRYDKDGSPARDAQFLYNSQMRYYRPPDE